MFISKKSVKAIWDDLTFLFRWQGSAKRSIESLQNQVIRLEVIISQSGIGKPDDYSKCYITDEGTHLVAKIHELARKMGFEPVTKQSKQEHWREEE